MYTRSSLLVTILLAAACGDDGAGKLPDAPIVMADADSDGIADEQDNCPSAENADQMDTDTDGAGNACDDDDDGDGVADATDNCPLTANADQADLDNDGQGDVCDSTPGMDTDSDGVEDGTDNCVAIANADQTNTDADMLGDACDDDDDGDGALDVADNCPLLANDQSNLDGDATGDACDDDDDNDTILDAVDNCPTVSNTPQTDGDMDNVGDACDGAIVPSFAGFYVGGGVVSAGKGYAGRFDNVVDTSVTLTISGIPMNATIRKAFLYWGTIGAPDTSVTLDGTAVTGTLAGVVGDTCWGIGENHVYRADVTTLVTGNKDYVVGDVLSALTGPDGQGTSLVVLYQDPADTRTNFVQVYDGVAKLDSAVLTLSGFTTTPTTDKIMLTTLVGDGQPGGDTLTVNSVGFGGADAYPGTHGAMWDNRIDDVTTAIPANTSSIPLTIGGGPDCLTLSGTILTITNAAPPPAPLPKTARAPFVSKPTSMKGRRTGGRIVR